MKNVRFTLLPAGTVQMGLSQAEEDAARTLADPPPLNIDEMRPVREMRIAECRMAVEPLCVRTVRDAGHDSLLAPAQASDESLAEPAFLTREGALEIAAAFACRLPTEAEWEYACRAGTRTLFPWGDELPEDRELASWVDLHTGASTKENAFGLRSLFSGNWCADEWRPSHAADSQAVRGVYVIKGGGSLFWPWQDSGEWVWCMPAIRMPSNELFEDRRCAVRLVTGSLRQK